MLPRTSGHVAQLITRPCCPVHLATLPRTSHVAQAIWPSSRGIWPCCPGHVMAAFPKTSGHVAQDIAWPRCIETRPCCPGYHLAELPRQSGHVAQYIWPCCPGYRLVTLPRQSGHVAQDIFWQCFWLLAMLLGRSHGGMGHGAWGMGVTAFHKERMLRSTRRSYRSHS